MKTIILTDQTRLEIDGARGVLAGPDGRVVVHAGGRDINIDLPPTSAVTCLTEEKLSRENI